MSAVFTPQRKKIDVELYHRMGATGILTADDRVELVDGDLLQMAPVGSQHSFAVSILAARLIELCGRSHLVVPQGPVRLSRYDEPQPDLLVLRGPVSRYREKIPEPQDVLLLVEISETTLRYDRSVKLPLYARHDIAEVWILDLVTRRLECHRDPAGNRYGEARILEPDVAADIAAIPGVSLMWGEVFG